MTTPRLCISSDPVTDSPADLILLLVSADAGTFTIVDQPGFESVRDDLSSVGFRGRLDELIRLPTGPSGTPLAVVGVATAAQPDDIRYAVGSAVRQLGGTRRLAVGLCDTDGPRAVAALEGAGLGGYRYLTTSSADAEADDAPGVVTIHAAAATEADLTRASEVASALALVKDLASMPPSQLYPETFAAEALGRAEGHDDVTVTVWDDEALSAEGFGGIVGVGSGSARPPRLIKVCYRPPTASRHLALVGKGITFDSGGLSLKSPVPMVGMKYDMTGAATVLAVVLAASNLRLEVRLTAWLCVAENMPSGSAMRPNDVLRIRNGTTVEVLNTDAEGRLVLADGLSVASLEHPDAIVDVATLTGAAVVALGTRYAAVMGDDELVADVLAAGSETGEHLWRMPLPAELRAALSSDVADIANATPGSPAAGMLVAATFLQQFVGTRSDESDERIPWAHLDIAGAAKAPAIPYGFTRRGPTGATVRALLRLAELHAGR